MKRLRRKLRSSSGASMLLALLFLLFCMTVGTIALTAASANAGRLSRNRQAQQDYLAVESAALLLKDDLSDLKLTGTYLYVYETHYSYVPTGEKDESGNDIYTVSVSHSDKYEKGGVTLAGSSLTDPLSAAFTQLFDSTHPPSGTSAPSSLDCAFTLQAGEGLVDVTGALSVAVTEGDRYAITITLSAADGSYPMKLYFRPAVGSVTASTAGTSENYTTTYTQTVAWQAAEITRGVGP